MLGFPLVYHDGYDLNFGSHVFPSLKYRLIRQFLLEQSLAGPDDFLSPEPATREQLLSAHTEEWISKLSTGRLSYHEAMKLEVPYSRRMVEAFFLAAGGTLLASRRALASRVAVNIGGGFHHAFAGHGEGFCAVNDIAVAIRCLQREGAIRTAMVIDLDNHHGNGTASIFAGAPDVFTISMHHFNNYPNEKPPSTIDIHLKDGCPDEEYLAQLTGMFDLAVGGFRPELIIYVAGADPYLNDQLGGLSLSKEGLKHRDRTVFETALRHGAPVAVTLAGGYAQKLEDTIELHVNTVLAARDALGLV